MRIIRSVPGWLLAVVLCSGTAGAHPVDEVVQGAYLTLVPGEVRLELDITPGADVARAILDILDRNGDRSVSEAETRAYAQIVLEQSTLTLDGRHATWTLVNVSTPPYRNLEMGSSMIRIYAVAERADRPGGRALTYENRYQPAKSQWIANVFLQPGAGWRYQITAQQRSDDGRQLAVSYVATWQ